MWTGKEANEASGGAAAAVSQSVSDGPQSTPGVDETGGSRGEVRAGNGEGMAGGVPHSVSDTAQSTPGVDGRGGGAGEVASTRTTDDSFSASMARGRLSTLSPLPSQVSDEPQQHPQYTTCTLRRQ